MSEVTEGFKLGTVVSELGSKVLGPSLTRRQADADAQARIQHSLAGQVAHYIDSSPMSQDVVEALITCGGRTNFINLAKIVQMAEAQLVEGADPTQIDDDWAANFKDKARTCSNDEMASLWAQLLAAEANNPGSYSRKTVNVLSDLEPGDARLFRNLADFRLIPIDPLFENNGLTEFKTSSVPPKLVVIDDKHPMYTNAGVNFASLARLEWLGLVRYVSFGYVVNQPSDKFTAYRLGNERLFLSSDGPISFGQAEFTPAGTQLSDLCIPMEVAEGFLDYLVEIWQSQGVRVARSMEEVRARACQLRE